jgi:hypothetical protein
MTKNVDEIVVGANGSLWVAPVGTAAPADEVAVPGAGWVDLGYASEDGVTITDSKTLEKIPVWQLFYAARRIVTERDLALGFVLRQWNAANLKLAFGGGEVTEPVADSGSFKYTPPSPETIDERSLMLDWVDGTKHYRLVVVRGMVTDNVETNLVRTAAADLPITFGLNGDDAGDPWYLLTDDPAFAPA